jgi:hypothetical protein
MYACLIAAFLALPSASKDASPVWQTDYTAARATARKSGKPLFVVFRCER